MVDLLLSLGALLQMKCKDSLPKVDYITKQRLDQNLTMLQILENVPISVYQGILSRGNTKKDPKFVQHLQEMTHTSQIPSFTISILQNDTAWEAGFSVLMKDKVGWSLTSEKSH